MDGATVCPPKKRAASCIFHTCKKPSGCSEVVMLYRRSRGRPTACEARCESEACFVEASPSRVLRDGEGTLLFTLGHHCWVHHASLRKAWDCSSEGWLTIELAGTSVLSRK